MVQINFALKEVNCKIVYYGPGMSGKTTNLEIVHQKAPESNKGELTSIATEGDRTLFFDFMPLDLGNIAGMRTKFQLYTVPGQVYYNSTRKLVLQGVDGIIFVADSQRSKREENVESLENLRRNLEEYGEDLNAIPLVIQYNKRDLPDISDVEDLDALLNPRGVPWFEGVATTGEGVFPTLKALSAMVLESLARDRGSAAPAPAAKRAVAASAPVRARAEKVAATPAEASRPAANVRNISEESFGAARRAPSREDAVPLPARPSTPSAPEGPKPLEIAARASPAVDRDPVLTPPIERGPSRPPSAVGPEAPGIHAPSHGRPESSIDSVSRGPIAMPIETPEQAPSHGPPPVRPPRGGDGSRWRPSGRGPRKGPLPNQRLRKFVIEEEQGSPLVLAALVLIILVAVGVILYSFKVF